MITMNYLPLLSLLLLLFGPSLQEVAGTSSQRSHLDDNNSASDSVVSFEQRHKIVGGEKVKWGEAPWQVAIFERDDAHDKFCGGALVGPRTVLTAAHCIDKGEENYPNHFVVRYGTLDFTKGTDVFVAKVNRHPNYDPVTRQNDIATLVLAASFAEGDNAAVIGLPPNDTASSAAPGASLLLTGWGHLHANDGQLSTSLMRASGLVVVDGDECMKQWAEVNPSVRIDPTKVICASSQDQSACFGDSGGPVVAEIKDGMGVDGVNGTADTTQGTAALYRQVGVISFGTDECTGSRAPNVYTSVAAYGDWIKANSRAYSGLQVGSWLMMSVLVVLTGAAALQAEFQSEQNF